ncbi:small nuclear ribonucleoprotein E-like protein [Tanacetum coccineum]
MDRPDKNLIFRFLQSKARIQIWLFEQKDLRIEGRIIGFDEYMNLVLDEAEEVSIKKKTRKPLGRILLKGDNITLMMNSYVTWESEEEHLHELHELMFLGLKFHLELNSYGVWLVVSNVFGEHNVNGINVCLPSFSASMTSVQPE